MADLEGRYLHMPEYEPELAAYAVLASNGLCFLTKETPRDSPKGLIHVEKFVRWFFLHKSLPLAVDALFKSSPEHKRQHVLKRMQMENGSLDATMHTPEYQDVFSCFSMAFRNLLNQSGNCGIG